MKNVRIFFAKDGPAKYISHLDLNRVMLRALGMSRIPVWRTEGFHQHAYITFALPLSLGYASTCESMDFRLTEDDTDMSDIPDRLNAYLPEGIRVFAGMKSGDVDPRCKKEHCLCASDKALSVGGGVLEALLHFGYHE